MKRAALILCLLAGQVFALDTSAWSHYLEITVDNTKVPGDLTDFTIPIDMDDLGTGHDFWATVISTGADIRFTKNDGTTELAYELVDIDTTAKTGEIHVNFAGTLSSTADTTIRMYYGNSGASAYAEDATYGSQNAWDSNFLAVFHLSGAAYGNILDSTANNHDATGEGGTPVYDSAGQLGEGIDFDGSGEYVTFGDDDDFSPFTQQAFTVEVWADFDISSAHQAPISKGDSGTFEFAVNYINLTNRRLEFSTYISNGNVHINQSDGATISTGQWYYIAGTISDAHQTSSTQNLYIDGSLANNYTNNQTNSMSNTTSSLQIGERDDAALDFDGTADEVRLSSVVRSADWIATTENAIRSPVTFSSFGTHTANPEAGGASFTPKVIFFE